jgi:putative ABC transport system substrate-binding protein
VDRRAFLGSLTGSLLAAPFAAEAQQAGKVYRIGLLGPSSPPTDPGAARLWEALLQGLRELGYVEGQNVRFERRYSEGKDERLPELAADLVRLKVDVIVAAATQPAHAAQRATTTLPIVAPNHSDPVGSGLVASLARPGGNVTGLSILNPELVGKQVELLKEVVPSLVRMAVLWNPTHQAHATMLSQAEAAARALGLQPQRLQARGADDYEPAFSAITRNRAQALLVLGDVTVWRYRRQVAELAAKSRLPAMFVQREHAEAGGLMSYGASLPDNYRRAAAYVHKILKGAKPADLPIEQPTKFELVINLKTAKALGLTIPPSLLQRADQVIE